MIFRFSGDGTSPATAAARVTTALRRAVTLAGRAAKAAWQETLLLMACIVL